MESSIQLWSVRRAVDESGWPSALGALADLGFRRVEPFAVHLTLGEIAGPIRDLQLDVPTVHGFLDDEVLDATLDAAQSLGAHTVIHPHLASDLWDTSGALERTATMLNRASERAGERGLRVAFHNHEVELMAGVGERKPIALLLDLLDPAVGIEFDTYWSSIADVDPVEMVAEFGNRIVALHAKDGPHGGPNVAQQALGDGDQPLEDVLAAVSDEVLFVLSLDQLAGDAAEVTTAVARSRAWLDDRRIA